MTPTTTSGWGWVDPRAVYGSPFYGAAHTYDVRRENTGIKGFFRPTYAVVRVSKYAVTSSGKSYVETLYPGLSKEAAEGFVKLLTEGEQG